MAPLRAQQRELLLCAAAIGREFDEDVLIALYASTRARVHATLRSAVRLQLVEPVPGARGRFRFRHALTRDAVYGALIAAQLRPLHREIAIALERLTQRTADVEELAYHWWAAGDAERGARYNEEAGDRAGAFHAHEAALTAYRRPLDVLPVSAAARSRLERKIAAVEQARATDQRW